MQLEKKLSQTIHKNITSFTIWLCKAFCDISISYRSYTGL